MEIKPLDPSQQASIAPSSPKEPHKEGAASASASAIYQARQQEVQDRVKVGGKNLQDTLKFMGNLRAVSDEVNAYAKFVRQTDVVLEKASNQVELMKKPLEAIMKNFPPFPADSQTRAELLKSYVSLRKEIDKLTVPPPLDVSTPALKQMFNDLFDGEGRLTAAKSFDLPEDLPPETTDHQILRVIEKLDTAKMQLDSGRVELGSSIK